MHKRFTIATALLALCLGGCRTIEERRREDQLPELELSAKDAAGKPLREAEVFEA